MTATDVSNNDTSKEDALVNRLRQLFTEMRQSKRPYYETWNRNYRIVNNRVGGKASAAWMPAPKDSEVYPLIASLVAWMADQHTTVDIMAAADPASPYYDYMQKLANDMATIIQTNWSVLDYESQVKLVLWDAFMFNTGIFKVVWDQGLDNGEGNVMLKRVDPWSFYVDANATSMEDSECFCEARRMSLNEIERRWPKNAAKVREAASESGMGEIEEHPSRKNLQTRGAMANPGNLPTSGTLTNYSTGGGYTRWSSPKHRTGPKPGVVVYEFWVKENEKIDEKDNAHEQQEVKEGKTEFLEHPTVIPRWRVVVTAAGVVLMDEYADELCTGGNHPYERYTWDDTGEFYGIALVDHLAYPQIYINRLLTALQQNAELVGNPVMVEAANSGMDRTGIVNRPGQRLRLSGPGGMQNKPEWLTPPSMPESVNQLVQFWIDRMGHTSGMTEAVMGSMRPTDRMSTDTMSSVQEAAFVRVRSALGNLESALKKSAYKMADLIIDNFDEPRYMATVGPQGMSTSLALKARHFQVPTEAGAPPFKYSLVIQAGASMPTSRGARVKEADQAYVWGIIDRQAWFEAHQYPNWQTVLQRVNEGLKDGSFMPPGAKQARAKAS